MKNTKSHSTKISLVLYFLIFLNSQVFPAGNNKGALPSATEKQQVTISQTTNSIELSEEVLVKVINSSGTIVFEGALRSLNVSNYYSGKYSLFIGSEKFEFEVRKRGPFLKNI